jgi:c-ets proto-oncogene protein
MQWSETNVAQWLLWATREFSLEGLRPENLLMSGKDICALGREKFLSLTPPYMGDILWEHLDILQRG